MNFSKTNLIRANLSRAFLTKLNSMKHC
ncbi:MAG: hypothetical protein O4750_07920 [Trichodesmium sp. St18_bin3_1_1]|nr:hypothetical protein [Trichodesmium sp. St5_bin8]MDE5091676.1 hypothetical protein [Trichodesmium sp. St18_bin3_1_1]